MDAQQTLLPDQTLQQQPTLIPTFRGQLGGTSALLVNARDLHKFLESRQDFSTWIKNRIDQYGFLNDVDYLFHKFVENPSGGRPAKEYAVSLDMAKELSMVERNEKGREARRYFIEMEKQALGLSRKPQTFSLNSRELIAAHKHLTNLMREVKREPLPAVRDTLYDQLQQICQVASITCPSLNDLTQHPLPASTSPTLGDFWHTVYMLIANNDPYQINHAHTHQLIALNLKQLEQVAKDHKVPLPSLTDLRRVLRDSTSPRFIDIRTVKSRHVGGSVKCWVFEQSVEEEA